MQSDRFVEGDSLRKAFVIQARVPDEEHRITEARGFQHFSQLAETVPTLLLEGLERSGFSCPTVLQSAAIPLLMGGRDVMAIVPNGCGKTVAYAVPSLAVIFNVQQQQQQRVMLATAAEGMAYPICLVLCSGREVALRVAAVYTSLGSDDVRVIAVDAAKDAERQAAALQGGCDVLVSTATRVQELRDAGCLSLRRVHDVVVDEPDKIFRQCDGVPLRGVLDVVRTNEVSARVSMWTATMTDDVRKITHQHMSPKQNTVMVWREEITALNAKHILYPLHSRDDRIDCLQHLYECRHILKRKQAVVYCSDKETAEKVSAEIASVLGAPSSLVKFVHSGVCSRRRAQVLEEFKRGHVRILVGTDMGTRQLDAPDLEHIIHYDLPVTADVFMLRVANVGRGARQGTSHTLLTPGDARVSPVARYIEHQTGQALSGDILRLVKDIEGDGGDNEWSASLIRFNHRAVHRSLWRVRGRRGGRLSDHTANRRVEKG